VYYAHIEQIVSQSQQPHYAERPAFKRTYDQFVDRVQIGRGKKIKAIEDVAQGRIFTGRQAVTKRPGRQGRRRGDGAWTTWPRTSSSGPAATT